MKIEKDGAGHTYVDVNGSRLTYIPANDRPEGKNWAGQDVIAIRAYRDDGKNLHMGAEIPIGNGGGAIDVIAALCALIQATR